MGIEITGRLNQNMVPEVLIADSGTPMLLISAENAISLSMMMMASAYRAIYDKAFFMVCADRNIPVDVADEMHLELSQYINIFTAEQRDVNDDGSDPGD